MELWWGLFIQSRKCMSLKFTGKFLCHYNEEWCKFIKIELSVQNWHEEFDKFSPERSKISKICILLGLFWRKYIVFELKKSIKGLYLIALNIDRKFEKKMTCAFKNDMRNLANFHQSMFESVKIRTLLGSFYPK